jgi:septal ring-binding cell division protein DamX
MSTVTPPPHDPAVPPAPAERRCPRCGSTLAPDQEWCLACGAAAETEVAEPRGWRVPIALGGGLGLLALIGVVLLIIALANGPDKLASTTPTPTPTAAVPTPATPSPVPTATPFPTATTSPGATTTPSPGATVTPTPSTTATPSATSTTTTTGSFPGWTGGNGWTIIIESATSQSKAESVATSAQGQGLTPGILKSDDYSSLNAGYWVVFNGHYASKSEAQSNLDSVRKKFADAYVRKIAS